MSTNPVFHPYAGALEASLRAAFPQMNVSTDVQGYNGDQTECPTGICPGFVPRMERLYQKPTEINHYDWAVILGGTNDLNWKKDAAEIYSSLQKVWSIPLSHGTKVLALTIPECGGCGDLVDERRDVLNELILNHKADNFYTFNLHDSVPYWSLPDEVRKIIWDDIVHFTPKGYDLVGHRIAEKLEQLIQDHETTKDFPPEQLDAELKR